MAYSDEGVPSATIYLCSVCMQSAMGKKSCPHGTFPNDTREQPLLLWRKDLIALVTELVRELMAHRDAQAAPPSPAAPPAHPSADEDDGFSSFQAGPTPLTAQLAVQPAVPDVPPNGPAMLAVPPAGSTAIAPYVARIDPYNPCLRNWDVVVVGGRVFRSWLDAQQSTSGMICSIHCGFEWYQEALRRFHDAEDRGEATGWGMKYVLRR
ncbi:hypothetical protein LXA43DRAFT_1067450 [Ganoderma leucocontextum]|nr:hypothetical protein LXA43DRAFT_1067450 [Ganoderma leucocontextum]